MAQARGKCLVASRIESGPTGGFRADGGYASPGRLGVKRAGTVWDEPEQRDSETPGRSSEP